MQVCAISLYNLFIFYRFIPDRQLQLVNFKYSTLLHPLHSLRFRLMSRQKINFFQSPNPKHFNLQHIRYDYHPAQDNDIHDDLLFTTPRRNNTQPNNPQDIAENQYGRLRRSSEDISEQHSHHEYMQLQPQSQPGIHAKLQFGEHLQDDLIPLTPLKPHRHRQQQDENLETVRRHPHLQNTSYPNVTPGSENRSNQRGLKKLAAQAYRFVMQQKRASYKQVARRLIEQTGDDTLLIQTNKRGEMNIKRRVYDALNVLIALGLLRRNGNKIFAKKDQLQFSGEDGSLARQRQRRREMMMEQELATLREACERKQVIVQQKRKLQLEMKDKVDRLKEVMERNRTTKQLPSDKDNKLKFPLITLCHNQAVEPATLLKRQNPFSKPSTNIQNEKQEQQLKIWRNNPQQLVCSFNKHQNISFLGEIDLLGTWKSHQRKGKPPKAQKVSRRR